MLMYYIVYWMVGLCYYGFLVNEGIGFILVIQTFHPSMKHFFISLLHSMLYYFTDIMVYI